MGYAVSVQVLKINGMHRRYALALRKFSFTVESDNLPCNYAERAFAVRTDNAVL